MDCVYLDLQLVLSMNDSDHPEHIIDQVRETSKDVLEGV
jgi:hypothetical protein